MPYINTETKQYPVSEQDIRNSLPNTSFAVPFNPDGYAYVFPTPQPTFDALSQYVTELAPVLTSKGTYEQTWKVESLPAATIAANKSARKMQELKTLQSTYKENQLNMQLSWLSAIVIDGVGVAAKKAAITADMAALKSTYIADAAAIAAKYA